MANKSFLFRVTSDGVDQLRKDLESLGPSGAKAFQTIASASPQLANALKTAEERADTARAEFERLNRAARDARPSFVQAAAAIGGDLRQSLEATTYRLGPLGAGLRALGPIGIAASAGAVAFGGALHKVFEATAEAEQASLRLNAVLKATGGVVGLTRKQLDDMADAMQASFHIDDDDIRGVMATLATFKSVAGDAFGETIKQAINMRAVFGGDLQSNIVQLGKALEDPVRGLTALRRSGLSFTEAQKDMIAALDKAGDRAGAQRVILGELEKQIGGTGAAAAGGLTGAVDRLSVAWGNFWESAPEKLGPVKDVLEILARGIERVTKDLSGPTLEETAANQWAELNKLLDRRREVDQNPLLDPFGTELPDLDKQIQAKNAELAVTRQLIQAAADKEAADQKAAKEAAERHAQELKAEAERAAADEAAKARAKEAARAAKDAAAEDKRLAEARKKATEDATIALGGQIASLKEETYQLGLSDRERFVRQQVLKAEQEVIKGTVEAGEEYVAQIEREAYALYDANKAIKDREKAEKDATKVAEDAAAERQKIAEREAELMLEPFKNAIAGVQDTLTDTFKDALRGNITDAATFWDKWVDLATEAAAQVAAVMVLRPAIAAGAGALGLDSLAASYGLGSLTGGSAQNAVASGSGVASSASTLAAIFGGAGGAKTGLGTWLNGLLGTGSPVYSNGIQIGASMPAWASFLNSGVGTGLVGAAAASGTSALAGGSWQQSAFAGGGALLGGIVGSIFPAVGSTAGAAAGGLLGNILGGLFGDKKKKPPKLSSVTSIEALASGLFGVGATATKHIGDVTSGLGSDAANTLNALLASLGATVNGPLSGQLQYYGRTPRFMSTVAGITNQFGNDEQGAKDAIADFIARTMVEAAQSDRLEGVPEAIRVAIANSGATKADQLDAAIAFGKFYERVDQIRTPAQAAAAAVTELAAAMAKAESQAEQYGLAAEKLPEIFKANFIDGIADQLLALKDPQAYALKQLDIEKAGAVAQAEKLGADLSQIEELYALKRQQIVEQGLSGVNSSFKDFFDSLLIGPASALSPTEQMAQARQRFDTAYQSGNAADFTAAAQQLLAISRDFYASTEKYADVFREVLSKTKDLGGLDVQVPGFAAGGDFSGGVRMVGERGPEIEASGPARYFDAQTTARIMQLANADLSPRMMTQILAGFGRYGADGKRDNRLAMLNDDEIALLIANGGAGSINPHTGLLEFYERADSRDRGPGTGNKGGSGGGGGRSGSTGGGSKSNPAINPGNKNLGLAGPDYSGPQGSGTGVDANNPSNAPGKNPNKGGGGWDKSFGPAPTSPISEDGFFDGSKVNTPNGPVDADKFFHDWADFQGIAYDDLTADDFLDKIGNFVASVFGFDEKNPVIDPDYNAPGNPVGLGANWGFDPLKLGLLIGGFANPVVNALSYLYGAYKWLGGPAPIDINMGPSVFGGPDAAPPGSVANDNAISSAPLAGPSLASGLSLPGGENDTPLGTVAGRSMVSPNLQGMQNSVASQAQAALGSTRTARGNENVVSELRLLRLEQEKTRAAIDRMGSEQQRTNGLLVYDKVRRK